MVVFFVFYTKKVGFTHGNIMADRIQKTWAFYRTMFVSDTRTESALEILAEVFLHNIEEFDENYKLEMEGIAEGSGVELWKIGEL
jgi:hypothetical protein